MISPITNLISCREEFRSRLENIVRGQVGSQSDSTSNNNSNDSSDQTQTNVLQNVHLENNEQSQSRNEDSEIDRLPDNTGNLERSADVERMNWQGATNHGGNWRESITENERGNWQRTTYGQFNEWRGGTTEDMDGNWPDSSVNNWPRETPRNVNGEEGRPQETHGVWHGDGNREGVDSWSEGPSGPLRNRRSVPFRRFNRFHPPDDDNVYSMELRELLSRYCV